VITLLNPHRIARQLTSDRIDVNGLAVGVDDLIYQTGPQRRSRIDEGPGHGYMAADKARGPRELETRTHVRP
ncbi:hypothetical protein Q8G19_28490, partial [Klebsiella pneumoniae]